MNQARSLSCVHGLRGIDLEQTILQRRRCLVDIDLRRQIQTSEDLLIGEFAQPDCSLLAFMRMRFFGFNNQRIWRSDDLKIFGLETGQGDASPIFTVAFDDLGRWCPNNFPFCVEPVLKI